MLDRPTRLTADEEALLRGLWVNGKRLADVAVEIGLSERQTARKLKSAGVALPGRGRPKGARDNPWCDRQRAKVGSTEIEDGAGSHSMAVAKIYSSGGGNDGRN